MPEDAWITVWLSLADPLPENDLPARYGGLAEATGGRLSEEGLGRYEGATRGTDNVGLSFAVEAEADPEAAVAVVIEGVRLWGLDGEAIVVHGGFLDLAGTRSHFERAVWPPGFTGELPR